MITLIANLYIKPGKLEEYKSLVNELICKSREEKGCLLYDLYENVNDCNKLTFIEIWEDEQSISLHNKSEHFTTIVPKLAVFQDGSTDVNLYRKISL